MDSSLLKKRKPPPQGLTPTNKFCNVWATFLLLFARLFICVYLSVCLSTPLLACFFVRSFISVFFLFLRFSFLLYVCFPFATKTVFWQFLRQRKCQTQVLKTADKRKNNKVEFRNFTSP